MAFIFHSKTLARKKAKALKLAGHKAYIKKKKIGVAIIYAVRRKDGNRI
jgi:hypothetical protein